MIISVVVENYYHFTNSGHMIILKNNPLEGTRKKIRPWACFCEITQKIRGTFCYTERKYIAYQNDIPRWIFIYFLCKYIYFIISKIDNLIFMKFFAKNIELMFDMIISY